MVVMDFATFHPEDIDGRCRIMKAFKKYLEYPTAQQATID